MSKLDNFNSNIINEAISSSKSLTEVCRKLNISTGGTNTNALKTYIEENNIDITHFGRKGCIKREDYEANPKLCKYCHKPLPWEKRMNEFCNLSCAASYNNQGISRNKDGKSGIPKETILDKISDDDFKQAVQNTSWTSIYTALGYSGSSNPNLKEKIIKRALELNIELQVKEIPKKDWSKITKGELFSYCKNWQSARTQIRKLAQKSFEESGKEYKCPVCGYTNHVEIAHIKAVSEFDDSTPITTINDPSNLIGLCPNHHWEYDNGILDISKYIDRRVE